MTQENNQNHHLHTNCCNPIPHDHNNALYEKLFIGNRRWVTQKLKENPNFFKAMASSQNPKYMLIGCSDSRCPPDQLTQTQPGELFIHRNVANLVVNSDMNLMSVLQYAVANLQVEHIIVLGHYGCGGVRASMDRKSHGLIDKWLCHIKDVYRLHQKELDAIKDPTLRCRRLVELNVQEQVLNVCKTSIVQRRWSMGSPMHVHGCVYDLETGVIHDLNVNVRDEWLKNNHMFAFEFDPMQDISSDAQTPRTPRSFSYSELILLSNDDDDIDNSSPLSMALPPKRKISWKAKIDEIPLAVPIPDPTETLPSAPAIDVKKKHNTSLLGIVGGFLGLVVVGFAWKSFWSAESK